MSKYTAIIIEPRKHRALHFVLTNFLHNLSNDWNIIIFHGINNVEYVKDIVDSIETDRISLINLNVENLNIFFSSSNFVGFTNLFIFKEEFLHNEKKYEKTRKKK